MTKKEKTWLDELVADFENQASRVELMSSLGSIDSTLCGCNAAGEDVMASIYPDKLIVTTHQANGWVRIDEYGEFGDLEAQTFNRRWK